MCNIQALIKEIEKFSPREKKNDFLLDPIKQLFVDIYQVKD